MGKISISKLHDYSHKMFKGLSQNTELSLNPTVVDFNRIPFVI